MYVCTFNDCGRSFKRQYEFKKHYKDFHINGPRIVEKCFLCGQIFNNCNEIQEHYVLVHKPSKQFIVKESAFRKNLITYRYNFSEHEKDFNLSQTTTEKIIYRQILTEVGKRVMCKISLIFIAEMHMTDHEGEKISRASIPFRSPSFLSSAAFPRNIRKNIRKCFQHQRNSLEDFMRNGSNWEYGRSLAFDIEIATLKPIRGGNSKYLNIQKFTNKTFLYNPPNKNNKCLLYCFAYFTLFGNNYTHKITKKEEQKIKKITKQFNTEDINFPSSIEDVKKFLKKNSELNLKVNILFRDSQSVIFPLEFGVSNGKQTCNLLLIETNKGGHFLAIRNADKYLRKEYQSKTGRKSYQKAFFCLHCLNYFYSAQLRDKHLQLCCMNQARKEVFPDDKFVYFKNTERKHMLDFIAFLDFECILPNQRKKCEECRSLKCKCDNSFTEIVNDQLPITYSFLVLGPEEKILHEHTYSGNNAHVNFIEHLLNEEQKWIKPLLESKINLVMTNSDQNDFNKQQKCYLCDKNFTNNALKCRDHCHVTAKYLGAACQECNLRRRQQTKLKIFIHNCSRYDMHFIIKAMNEFQEEIKNISILPYNSENFRTLSFNSFEFLDSLSFLQASLSQLSTDLKETEHNYEILKQTFLVKKNKKFCEKRFHMVLEKSFFPYEYCTSLHLMMKTKELPTRKKFYSNLSEQTISVCDYKFAQSVWSEFQCENLVDYTELYCKIDTVLLAEIFQAFRKRMYNFSELDPAHYISLPSYAYDSMLKITNCVIELPTDINMIHFLESAKRGGVSFINTRYLASNTITNDINSEIIYIDANNLYGLAQMANLPYSNFRWLTNSECENFSLDNLNVEGEFGYMVECDLHYPKHLHKKHSNLPLAPEVLQIEYDNLSPYAKNAVLLTDGKQRYQDVKLMSTFHDRKNYVTHIKNLQLYLSLGMKLKKIHRILEFKQKKLIAPYIEKTTKERQLSTTKFEKNLFKLLVILIFLQNIAL